LNISIWLLDLARHLPSSARIDGYDIDLTQCPPKEWLPDNVSVHMLDCLKPLSEHLLATYDVVHIQLFHLAVHNNDPGPIIENLVKLLSKISKLYVALHHADHLQSRVVGSHGVKSITVAGRSYELKKEKVLKTT
jgi:hypothetical protein